MKDPEQAELFGNPEPLPSKVLPPRVSAEIARDLAAQLADPPKRRAPDAMHLLLLDARSLLDACYYAAQQGEQKTTASGVPIGGVSGYASGLLQLLHRTKPTHALATFDHPEGSADRKAILSGYKDRPDKPLDHLAQIDIAQRITRALGLPAICTPVGEADDVVATVLRRAPEDAEVTIYSTDKDLLALLTRQRTRLVWRRRGEWYEAVGQAGAIQRLGVRCDQVTEFLALAGDAADGVPGCEGVGQKTAQRLLELHGNIDTIYSRLDRLGISGAPRVAELLRKGKTAVLAARSVVRLRTDLDCPQVPQDAAAIRALSWSWDRIDSAALDVLGRELGLLWLQREAMAAGQDRS